MSFTNSPSSSFQITFWMLVHQQAHLKEWQCLVNTLYHTHELWLITRYKSLSPYATDELDSYMYQTVGHQAIELYAEAMDLPLYRRTIQGSSLNTGRNYSQTEGDEVEDLYELLRLVKVGVVIPLMRDFYYPCTLCEHSLQLLCLTEVYLYS